MAKQVSKKHEQPKELEEKDSTNSAESNSEEKEKTLLVKETRAVSMYKGPLPPPHILAEYDKIIPNGAERIFREFEKQGEHRRDIEKENLNLNKWGQWFAFAFGILGLGASFSLAMYGHEGVAVGIGVASIGSLAIAFIAGKKQQHSNPSQNKKD